MKPSQHPLIGSRVEWPVVSSRRAGGRSGVVLAIVPAGASMTVYARLHGARTRARNIASHERAIVRVDRIGEHGKPLVPHFYAPSRGVVSVLASGGAA